MAKQKTATPKAPAQQNVTTNDVDAIVNQLVDNTNIKAEEEEEGDSKKPGRPVDPNSPRQKRLLAIAVKQLLGVGHRGRPVDPNSERQQRLTEMEERRLANGGVLKPGRPAMSEDEKKKLAAQRDKTMKSNAADIAAKAKEILIKQGKMTEDGQLIDSTATEQK
jgi:hypothetical protein